MKTYPLSQAAFVNAKKVIPGGVNSPVRAFGSLGGQPLFIDHASGPFIWDVDGNCYTDFCLSWGVFINGHNHPVVQKALSQALAKGTSFGAPTISETMLAEEITSRIPSMEQVRFVSSGTEAVMSAIRLARAATGRDIIIKFEGCYHGHADHLLVKAGSGAASLPGASSAGVPQAFTACTLSVPFNNEEALNSVFQQYGHRIAAIITEPVPANMGVVLPANGFLQKLRDITRQHGALLIFDEVITGFRLARGGAQELYGIEPDLTTLGKICGGGLPMGAFGGRRELMQLLAPVGPVYQAGTLSGNPLATAAGMATLQLLTPQAYESLWLLSKPFVEGMQAIARTHGIVFNHVGPMFTLFFSPVPVNDYASASATNQETFRNFYLSLLDQGVYLAPAQNEASFISLAHTPELLDQTLEAVTHAVQSI